MVLYDALLNTQQYEVRIKGKVEQSREWSSALPDTSVVAIEKGAFGSTLTTLTNFTFYIFIVEIFKKLKYFPSCSVVNKSGIQI